eukprot:TRINITY_DN26696_c0_g1_i1.p1 TRINITY_DN26696_c0_g1~~TRINITY_DN26696_c0_g1_i1.p1  ORF type:complete len:728 (-),score=161.06 TRINITY_DN26696_c0_g1_i1:136-2319(-)
MAAVAGGYPDYHGFPSWPGVYGAYQLVAVPLGSGGPYPHHHRRPYEANPRTSGYRRQGHGHGHYSSDMSWGGHYRGGGGGGYLPEPNNVELVEAIQSLCLDQLRPYGRILRKRIAELSEAMGTAVADVDVGRLRQLCLACREIWVEAHGDADWSAVVAGSSHTFVDIYSTHDDFPEALWRTASEYFEALPEHEMRFPGGRYVCAVGLRNKRLPFLEGYSLGRICHFIQIAMSKRKLLGYREGAIVPYRWSHTMVKEQCAEQGRLCRKAKMTLATWETLRECLRDIVERRHISYDGIPLSNIKRMLRARFHLDLCETALGHATVSDLFKDERLSDLCTMKLLDNGYSIYPKEFAAEGQPAMTTPVVVQPPAQLPYIDNLLQPLQQEPPPQPAPQQATQAPAVAAGASAVQPRDGTEVASGYTFFTGLSTAPVSQFSGFASAPPTLPTQATNTGEFSQAGLLLSEMSPSRSSRSSCKQDGSADSTEPPTPGSRFDPEVSPGTESSVFCFGSDSGKSLRVFEFSPQGMVSPALETPLSPACFVPNYTATPSPFETPNTFQKLLQAAVEPDIEEGSETSSANASSPYLEGVNTVSTPYLVGATPSPSQWTAPASRGCGGTFASMILAAVEDGDEEDESDSDGDGLDSQDEALDVAAAAAVGKTRSEFAKAPGAQSPQPFVIRNTFIEMAGQFSPTVSGVRVQPFLSEGHDGASDMTVKKANSDGPLVACAR